MTDAALADVPIGKFVAPYITKDRAASYDRAIWVYSAVADQPRSSVSTF